LIFGAFVVFFPTSGGGTSGFDVTSGSVALPFEVAAVFFFFFGVVSVVVVIVADDVVRTGIVAVDDDDG
jgi:hypothetical protein